MTDLHNSATFQNRFNQAQRFIAPTMRQAGLDLSKMRALEIGCGEGAKVCALAPLFETYVGIDLDPHELAIGQANVEAHGIQNAELRLQAANDLPQLLAQESFDVIFLYAVIEHLTIEERLNTLKLCWTPCRPTGCYISARLQTGLRQSTTIHPKCPTTICSRVSWPLNW